MKKLILILAVVSAVGCSSMSTLSKTDCWVFVGEAEFSGTVTKSNIEGKSYIRKGTCSEADINAALAALAATS